MQNDLEFFRKEYVKQKKLEKIINSRIIYRPNVKKWQVATVFAILPFLLATIILSLIFLKISTIAKILLCITMILFVVEIYLRFCFVILVKYYQAIAKEETRRRCQCIPSCSEYAVIALKRVFPLLKALLKIRKRLYKTCNGEEYKIDFPIKKMGERFESKL